MVCRFRNYLLGMMAFLISVPTFAHPGHGSVPADNLVHYIVEPVHAVILVGILVVCLAVRMYRKKQCPSGLIKQTAPKS